MFRIFGRKREENCCEFEDACNCSRLDKLKTCERCQFYYGVDSGGGYCRAMPKFEPVAWCRDTCSLYKERRGNEV